jgi:hypothetical protein
MLYTDIKRGPNLSDLHFNRTWGVDFPSQGQRISHGALYGTLDMSAGYVLTMSHAMVTQIRFVLTLLLNTGLLKESCFS